METRIEEITWPNCDLGNNCENDAQYYDQYLGCPYCGGLECGDTAYVEFQCGDHKSKSTRLRKIPLCVDPYEHCYEFDLVEGGA